MLFIGDSLVTGVGCSPERGLGPALPRSVAESASRLLRQDVEWIALGHTGGNVREIVTSQVPRMRAEVARAEAAGERFDAVVVVVGLNDIKKAYRGAQFTAGSFRNELEDLVRTIQQAAGEQCLVVLPALPVHRAPVFDRMQPLQSFLHSLAGLWDDQKRALAHCLPRVRFVQNAEGTEWWTADCYWAADGIHPNDEGYRIWGEHIAQSVAQGLLSSGL